MNKKMVLTCVLGIALTGTVTAGLVQLKFSGTFTESYIAGINANDTFEYFLTYDDATVDALLPNTQIGSYFGALQSVQLNINGNTFWAPDTFIQASITITDNGDYWGSTAQDSSFSAQLDLRDYTKTALSNDSLVAPDLAAFADSQSLYFENNMMDDARGTITSIEAVPEPATAGLLAISSLILVGLRRIKKCYGLR